MSTHAVKLQFDESFGFDEVVRRLDKIDRNEYRRSVVERFRKSRGGGDED